MVVSMKAHATTNASLPPGNRDDDSIALFASRGKTVVVGLTLLVGLVVGIPAALSETLLVLRVTFLCLDFAGFGFLTVIVFIRFISRGPLVLITHEGVWLDPHLEAKTIGTHVLAWSEIRAVIAIPAMVTVRLGIQLADPQLLAWRQNPFQRVLCMLLQPGLSRRGVVIAASQGMLRDSVPLVLEQVRIRFRAEIMHYGVSIQGLY
jgi:hypothetical protein